MKSSLLSSYQTFLSFYLLMKAEGRDCTDHAVLGRLTNLKDLLGQLAPLDAILQKQATKSVKVSKDKIESEEDEDMLADDEEGEMELDEEEGEMDFGDDYSSADQG